MYDDIDPRNLPAGTVVDGYTLVGKIGGGGMGEIYRVQRGEETFALKIQGERLSAAMDPAKREELEARSRREAAILMSLSHPNILAIVGTGRWPDRAGYLYLLTELVPGEPLDAWHERRQPSLRQLTRVFERVADALDYMHRAGIYHRDLKDTNVLVREDATPVVIDLGIARSAAAYTLTRVGAVIGTTTHLSPGICRYLVADKSEKARAYRFGPHDDLHALGFMLYERLTGTPPFRQRSDVEWPEFDYYRQVMKHVPPGPRELYPAVPEALSALTCRLLSKTAESSYPSAAALRAALQQLLTSAPAAWDEAFPVPRGVERRDLTRSGPPRLPAPEAHDVGEPGAAEASVAEGEEDSPSPTSSRGEDNPPVREPPGDTERAIAALRQQTAPAQPAAGSPAFRPPTLERHTGFVLPETGPREAGPLPQPLSGDALVRHVSEQMQAEKQPRRRLGVLPLTLLGATVLLGVTFLAKLFLERPVAAPKSLLQHYREELTAEQEADERRAAPGVAAVGPALPASATAQQAPLADEKAGAGRDSAGTETVQATRTPARKIRQASSADESAIQSELEQAYGSKRPTLPGKAAAANMPSWVKGVEVVDAKPTAPAGEHKLGGRYGDHVRLQLKSNLDSRLCGSGAVEAVLVRPYLVNDAVVLPLRTLAYGQCTAQGGRFLVTFTRLRLPDGAEVHFDGVAMDVTDEKPGLLASRRLGTGAGAQEGLGSSVLRSAASSALGVATSGASAGAQVAGSAGQTVVNSRPQESGSAGEDAILLDAGAGIDVFLRQAF